MFSVVYFNKKKSSQVVLSKWLVLNEQKCYCPPKSIRSIEIMKDGDIDFNWPTKDCSEVKYKSDDFSLAQEKCKKLVKGYETGDIETADSETEKRRRRKYSKKRSSDYEYDSGSRKTTKSTCIISDVEHNSSDEIIPVGTSNKKNKTTVVASFVPTKRVRGESFEGSLAALINAVHENFTLITSVHEDNIRFQERLELRLTNIEKRLKKIEMSSNNLPQETTQSSILPSFPLSHESLNQFDDSLRLNKEVRKNMIQWITYRCGNNAQETCKNIFRDFFASDIGMFGCWSGKGHNGKQKISLCNLELVIILEEVFVKKQFDFSRSMISEYFRKEIRKSYDKTLKIRKKNNDEEIGNLHNEDMVGQL